MKAIGFMRLLTITISVLLQFTFISAQSAHAEALKLLALGDSLTAGYGLGPGDRLTDRLQAKIDEAYGAGAVRIINAGVSGDTTKGGLARLDWALFDEPDMALVALGGNDMLRGLEPQDSYENLDGILARLEKEGVPVLLAGMLAPANMGADYQADFDKIYPDLARDYDVVFYPFFLDGVALMADLNQPDGLHPNRQGVDVMVGRIFPAIEELIARSKTKIRGE
jgi:acyl-CoA thioesterase-1